MKSLVRSIHRKAYRQFASEPDHLVGPALARIVFGIWLLAFYLQGLPIHGFLWGSGGPISFEIFNTYLSQTGKVSLLAISGTDFWLFALIGAGLVSALGLLLGLFTRSMLLVSLVLLWSFHARNPYILTGGDNVGRIVMLFMLFLSTNRYWSLDSHLGWTEERSRWTNIAHHFGFLAILFQMCALYLTSALSKATGELWQNGTAVYYVLRSDVFGHPGIGDFLASHYLTPTILTYAVLGLQLSFAFLVWNRRIRPWLIGALSLMHVGIAIVMGLWRFSFVVIGSLMILVPDEVFHRTATKISTRLNIGRVASAWGWKPGDGSSLLNRDIARTVE